MENICGVLVSISAPFQNHIANGGEKLLGNASSIKRTPDGKVYVSGQMQRHVLFSAMERINQLDSQRGQTYVSNGDGVSNKVEIDLRADLGGFMHPSKGDYSGRRTAPLSATPAIAFGEKPSKIGRDLLIRIKNDKDEKSKDQALATREFSEFDEMHMNFFLDISSLSISKAFEYANGFHIDTKFIKHVNEKERKRRVNLFLEATRSMNDYANQARNAVSGEPRKVLIVFDTKLSRKASRFFSASQMEQANILGELQLRKANYFIGDDTEGDVPVAQAYEQAFELLANSSLFDPCKGDANIKTFAEAFGD